MRTHGEVKAMRMSNRHRVVDIDPKSVVDDYKDRVLSELSDAEIFDSRCCISPLE